MKLHVNWLKELINLKFIYPTEMAKAYSPMQKYFASEVSSCFAFRSCFYRLWYVGQFPTQMQETILPLYYSNPINLLDCCK